MLKPGIHTMETRGMLVLYSVYCHPGLEFVSCARLSARQLITYLSQTDSGNVFNGQVSFLHSVESSVMIFVFFTRGHMLPDDRALNVHIIYLSGMEAR